MIRNFTFVVAAIFLIPTLAMAGDWVHPEMYQRVHDGEMSEAEVDQAFTKAQAECKIGALQIQIPSPSCTQTTPVDCPKDIGFIRGACLARADNQPQQTCNYTAVESAHASRTQFIENCMITRGWTTAHFEAKTTAPKRTYSSHDSAPSETETLIRLTELVPDWRSIDNTSEWRAYLAGHDELTGMERQEILEGLFRQGNAEALANMFRQFKKVSK